MLFKKLSTQEEEKIKKIFHALDERIKAAEAVSAKTDDRIAVLKGLMEGIEAKKIEVQAYLERINTVLKAIDEALPPKGTETAHFDRYKEASKLAEQGCGIDEIVKRVGLPKGEVQLIVGLKKH